MPGQLFTQYFLTDGIQATDEWTLRLPRQKRLAHSEHVLLRPMQPLISFMNLMKP